MLPFQQQPGNSALLGLLLANTTSAPTSRKVNISAVVDPGVSDDSSAGYGVGSFWINTASSKIFFCSDASVGAANWINSSGGSTSKETITAANSFVAGDIVRRTSVGYTKAQADSAANAETLGLIESATGSDFTIVYFGKLSLTAHGFTVGDVIFLSAGTAGLLTATEPSTAGQVSKPVALALDADNLLVTNMRGIQLGSAGAGYTSTTLNVSNVTLTPGTSPWLQKLSGTCNAPLTVNILRTGAATGNKYEVALSDVNTTGTNTLIFQENSSGSLKTLSDVGAASGKIEFVFNGTSWEIFTDRVQYV